MPRLEQRGASLVSAAMPSEGDARACLIAWAEGGVCLGCRPHRDDLQDVDQCLGEVPTQGQ